LVPGTPILCTDNCQLLSTPTLPTMDGSRSTRHEAEDGTRIQSRDHDTSQDTAKRRASPFAPLGLRLPPPHNSSNQTPLPPPTPSLAHLMEPSRSAPHSHSQQQPPPDWAPSAQWPSTARAGWSTNLPPRQRSPGPSFGSRLPPIDHTYNPYRPHTSYYPQHPPAPLPPSRPHTTTKHSNGTEEGSGKKKKRRIALACAECAKRKQRCNRETPCQHCLSRRVPELCVPYTRSGTPPPRGVKLEPATDRKASPKSAPEKSALPTLSVRMARVEDLLNVMVNRVPGVEGSALDAWRISKSFGKRRAILLIPRPSASALTRARG
jgi:hypothetical protein